MTIGIAPNLGEAQELIDGSWAAGVASGNNYPSQKITAFATGGQASATQISASAAMVEVETCANDHDSIKLNFANPGRAIMVFNASAKICDVYGQVAKNKVTGAVDKINGTAGSTAYSIAAGKSVLFFAADNGEWAALLSA